MEESLMIEDREKEERWMGKKG